MKKFVIALLSFTLLISCSKNDLPKDYTTENEQEIQQYLIDNNLTATKDDNGIYYIIEEEGTGEFPIDSNVVKIIYEGSFTHGQVVVSSEEKGSYLILQNIITGLRYGIPYFKTGGSGKIILPSSLAFGGESVIVFDIDLLEIYDDIDSGNDAEIVDYLVENDLTDAAIKTDSGLYYILEDEGSGENPTSTDNVTVAYKGYYTNNEIFDENNISGFSFNLEDVIDGWKEGIPYFKEGGYGKLLIPSSLGYNDGHVRIFDVELISID